MAKSYYLTTPIYYVNSVPHVGHILTMLACDVTKRFRQMRGEQVKFLTGTDENGLKVYEAAQESGEEVDAFVSRISQAFRDSADQMGIDYDIFFRTTSQRHKEAVQALFARLEAAGTIYQGKYEGWYDVSAETFVKESEVIDGKSPDGNPVRWVSEDNYFFRLSAFGDQLLAHAEANPEFWQPAGRKAEVVSFIKQGLRDVCITRDNPGWGIPVPGNEGKVVYVWFDALINYLAASGWPEAGWDELWPADVHWMAKEIFTRFHATLWPAMLMAAGLPLPKAIIAHGWFTFKGGKMSKSVGNVLAPPELIEHFTEAGVDPLLARDVVRYSLMRTMPATEDKDYSLAEVERLYNSEMANELGNALNRTVSMAHKFMEGVVPAGDTDGEVLAGVQAQLDEYAAHFEANQPHAALEVAVEVVRRLNRYIAETTPWALHKQADPSLPLVMRTMFALLRACEATMRPFIPATSDAIAAQLGLPAAAWPNVFDLSKGVQLQQPIPMFPRLEITKPMNSEEPVVEAAPPKPAKKPAFEPPAEIGIEDVMKVQLKVGRILEAEAVEKSDKLVKLQVLVGTEQRQILAGIRKSYDPADLVGMQIVIVANLKPAKLMGLESQGMVLAADGPDGQAILLQPEKEAPEGTSVH